MESVRCMTMRILFSAECRSHPENGASERVDTTELGGDEFVLSRAGVFFSKMGENVDGKTIWLHKDGFE